MNTAFTNSYQQLVALFAPYRPLLITKTESDTDLYLETRKLGPNRKPLYFGGVFIKKSYVAFHLMPAYLFPDLVAEQPDFLQKRMQGKSCWNFKQISAEELASLAQLVEEGVRRFEQNGYL